jgi:hypothetical protein
MAAGCTAFFFFWLGWQSFAFEAAGADSGQIVAMCKKESRETQRAGRQSKNGSVA